MYHRDNGEGRGMSIFQAAKLDIQRKEFEYLEKNSERNAERTVIKDTYQTAKDMLDNYGEYTTDVEKRGWFKVLNEKAILITNASGPSKATSYAPSPCSRTDSFFLDSDHTSSITTSSTHSGRVSSSNTSTSKTLLEKTSKSSVVVAGPPSRVSTTTSKD